MAAISLIGVAVILDGLDGPLARFWNCTSELGGYLDSQADLISFGLAPAFVVYSAFFTAIGPAAFLLIAPYTLAAAIRLAIFNRKMAVPTERDRKSFGGMPAIVAAGFLLAPVLAANIFDFSYNATIVMPSIALVCGALMISSLPFPRVPLTTIFAKKPLLVSLTVMICIAAYGLKPWWVSFTALGCYALWTAWTWFIQIIRPVKRSRPGSSDMPSDSDYTNDAAVAIIADK